MEFVYAAWGTARTMPRPLKAWRSSYLALQDAPQSVMDKADASYMQSRIAVAELPQ